jgi:hypothetical protein
MRPLDIIVTPAGHVGMITEVCKSQENFKASIEFFKGFEGEKAAWWDEKEFTIIDNFPDILSRNMNHPMGTGSIHPYAVKGNKNEYI